MKWTNIVSEVVEDLLLQISSPSSSMTSTTDSSSICSNGEGDLNLVSGCGDVNYDGDDECGGRHDSIHRLRNSVSSRGSSSPPSEESINRRSRRRRVRRRERDIKVRVAEI